MTQRAMATIKDVLENKMPVSTAMRKNGYSVESARNLKIKETEAWKQVMETYLPDHKLYKAHQDALEATKLHGTDSDFVEIPDHVVRLKAVEMAYKIKGRMSENGGNIGQQVNITLDSNGYIPPSNVLQLTPTLKPRNLRNKLKP